MARPDAREMGRREWGGAAPGWRRWDAQLMAWAAPLTTLLLEVAQVRPGMRVLDLASGTGEPALTLAAAVGPDGHVTATDLVEEMLAAVGEKAGARGLANVTARQAAAEALPFADESFDLVTCRLGVMHFADPAAALREARRVLRPDARAGDVAWGPLEENGFHLAMLGPFARRGLVPPPAPGAANPFQFAQPEVLAAALEAAGFRAVAAEARRLTMAWPGTVDEWLTSIPDISPLSRHIRQTAPPAAVEDGLREVRAAAEGYADGGRINFPAAVVLGTGVR